MRDADADERNLRRNLLILIRRIQPFQQEDILSAFQESGETPYRIKKVVTALYKEGKTVEVPAHRGEDQKYVLTDSNIEERDASRPFTISCTPIHTCIAELAAWIRKGYNRDPEFRKLVSEHQLSQARNYLHRYVDCIPTIQCSAEYHSGMDDLVGSKPIHRVIWPTASLPLIGKAETANKTPSIFFPSKYEDWECVKTWDVLPPCPHRGTPPDKPLSEGCGSALDFGKPMIPREEGLDRD